MKAIKIVLLALIMQGLTVLTANAGDFDWLRDLNVQATADSSGFRLRLATRFKIGDAEVKTVIGNMGSPADAYMVLRLGELSGRSTNDVIKVYRTNKNKGWGVIAKNLGIKPGSREFHALKNGHDLSGGRHMESSNNDHGNHGGDHGNSHKDNGKKGKH